MPPLHRALFPVFRWLQVGMGFIWPVLAMKPCRLILYALLIALAACLWWVARFQAEPVRPDAEPVVVFHPLEATAPTVAPVAPPTESCSAVPPIAGIEPERPVQNLEERGDAMLFEASALEGTPFDQAVVMPFE
jgi:hypothetical protein